MKNVHIFLITHKTFENIGGSGSGKTNTLLNLIKEQDYHDVIDKIAFYGKDLSEPKYEHLIKNVKMQK